MRTCRECKNKYSSKAPACPQCGRPAPKTNRAAQLFLFALVLGAGAVGVGVIKYNVTPQSAQAKLADLVPDAIPGSQDIKNTIAPDAQTQDPNGPQAVITAIKSAGLRDAGDGWRSLNGAQEPTWGAKLATQFGANEVSVTLQSGQENTVDRIEIKAEILQSKAGDAQVINQFTRVIAAIYPEAPQELLRAVNDDGTWSGEGWRLTRENIPSGGYVLRLSKK